MKHCLAGYNTNHVIHNKTANLWIYTIKNLFVHIVVKKEFNSHVIRSYF